jgi:hypothetical protein
MITIILDEAEAKAAEEILKAVEVEAKAKEKEARVKEEEARARADRLAQTAKKQAKELQKRIQTIHEGWLAIGWDLAPTETGKDGMSKTNSGQSEQFWCELTPGLLKIHANKFDEPLTRWVQYTGRGQRVTCLPYANVHCTCPVAVRAQQWILTV